MNSTNSYLESIQNKLLKDRLVYIRVKANPKSKLEKIQLMSDNLTLKVNIKSAPVGGKANIELITKIEQLIGHNCQAKIISGEHSQIKLIKITI